MTILAANITVVRSLAEYLKIEIPILDEVYEEWPNPNQDLVYPSISIVTVGTAQLLNFSPTISSTIDNVGNPALKDVTYYVGDYNLSLQVDIWTEYKEKRGELLELFGDAIDKGFIDSDGVPMGLSLPLLNYHGALARYDQVGYNYMDSERGSQMAEWRVKVDLLVNFPKLKIKTQSTIDIAEVHHNIDEDGINKEDDNLETKVIF